MNGTHLTLGLAGVLAAGAALSRRGSLLRSWEQAEPLEVRVCKRRECRKADVKGWTGIWIQESRWDAEALLLINGRQAGHAKVFHVRDGLSDWHLEDSECSWEIQQLVRRIGSDGNLWSLWDSHIDTLERGQGYGVQLYEALLRHLGREKPAILFPEACVQRGRTSEDAYRVWVSLGRRWVHEGDAVVSIPLPTQEGR